MRGSKAQLISGYKSPHLYLQATGRDPLPASMQDFISPHRLGTEVTGAPKPLIPVISSHSQLPSSSCLLFSTNLIPDILAESHVCIQLATLEEISLVEFRSQGFAFYQIDVGNVGNVPDPAARWQKGGLDTKQQQDNDSRSLRAHKPSTYMPPLLGTVGKRCIDRCGPSSQYLQVAHTF